MSRGDGGNGPGYGAGITGEDATTTAWWITQRGEQVGIGDTVALDLLDDKDAVGVIAGPSLTGSIRCRFVASRHREAISRYTCVTEDQLLMKLPEQVTTWAL